MQSGHVRVPATGNTKQGSRRLGSLCYSLCVCVSPKFICPKPRPRRDGAGMWAVRMGSSRRTSALREETAAGLLLCQATHKEKSATHSQEEGPAEGEGASTSSRRGKHISASTPLSLCPVTVARVGRGALLVSLQSPGRCSRRELSVVTCLMISSLHLHF